MRYLRKSELEPLVVSMCGLKLGHRFLVIGSSDTDLVWRLAAKVGLTGRACLLDESAAQTAAAAAAVEQQGALVESFTAPFTSLPFEAGAFDAVVLRNVLGAIEPSRRSAAMNEVMRVVRPGGRCIAIEDLPQERHPGSRHRPRGRDAVGRPDRRRAADRRRLSRREAAG